MSQIVHTCGKCCVEMRCSKTGRYVVRTSAGMPYQVWCGDEFTCPQCGAVVVTEFGRAAVTDWSDDPDRFQAYLSEAQRHAEACRARGAK